MVKRNRVPNSFLLVGDEGVGKKQFALELARSILCKNPLDGEACGECASCRRAGVFDLPKSLDKDDNEKLFFSEHSDVAMLRPAGKFITVNQIRELEREANSAPFEGAARFFIIDNADQMNDAAANALLKTLEEPPKTAHLFLISSRPDALLQTIRSRCQMIRFAPVAVNEIIDFVVKNQRVAVNEAPLAARFARGSVGRAAEFELERYKQFREQMLTVFEAATIGANRLPLLKTADEMNDAKAKDDYETRLDILEILIRDALILSVGAEREHIVNYDLGERLGVLVRQVSSRSLEKMLLQIEETRRNFAVNINRKIATDALFMKMSSL